VYGYEVDSIGGQKSDVGLYVIRPSTKAKYARPGRWD